jgi:heat shock protein HtpX
MGNTLKTTLLLGLLTGLIISIGGYFGGQGGMVIAFLFAVIMNFGAYWFSDKIVLRMYRAREVDPTQAPDLYRMVERLAQKAGIPTPKVFVIPSESPNAFATGRNPEHAVVAVTQGILRLMNDEELEGVLAHELGHVKNRDILISSIAATLAGAIMMLASMARWAAIFGGFGRDDDDGGGIFGLLFMAILAPLAAVMIQMAISRTREYKADATAAEVTGTPYGLAHALEKLGKASQRIPMEANPSTAHMFIVNPLSGRPMMKLFSTHPPLEDRIRRLLGR